MSAHRCVATFAVSAMLFVACGSDDGADTEATVSDDRTIRVTAVDFGFEPNDLEVDVGDVKVDLENAGRARHTFTIDGLDVDRDLDPGERVTIKLTLDAGKYEFHCRFHASAMKGTITVGG